MMTTFINFGIIDVSAVVHYNIRSSTINCKHAKCENSLPNIFNSSMRMIQNLCDAHNIDAACIIMAYDCSRKNIWRHSVIEEYSINHNVTLPVYKGKRDEANLKNTNNGFDKELYYIVIRALIEQFPDTNAYCDKLEGDDMVALVLERLPPWAIAHILTVDQDLLQLTVRPQTHVYHCRNPILRMAIPDEPATLIVNKCLYGDVSDNIKGSFINKKAAGGKEKIADIILEIVNNDMVIPNHHLNIIDIDKFNLNLDLMDLRRIPCSLKSRVLKDVDEIINKALHSKQGRLVF